MDELSLLLRADSDGVGPFGLTRHSSSIQSSEPDSPSVGAELSGSGGYEDLAGGVKDEAWWKREVDVESKRNSILQRELRKLEARGRAEKSKLDQQLSEEHVRHQRRV